jgi:hypothetical protein
MAMFYLFAQYSTTKAQLPQEEHLSESCETAKAKPTTQNSLRGDQNSLPFSRITVQDLNHHLSGCLSLLVFSRIVSIYDVKFTRTIEI